MGLTIITPPTPVENLSCSISAGGTFPTGTWDFIIEAKNVASYIAGGFYLTSCSAPYYVTPTTGNQTMNFTFDYKAGYYYYMLSWRESGSNTFYTSSKFLTPTTQYSLVATSGVQCSASLSSSAQVSNYKLTMQGVPYDLPISKTNGIGMVFITGSIGTITLEDMEQAITDAGQDISQCFILDKDRLQSLYHIKIEAGAVGSLDVSSRTLNFFNNYFINYSNQFTITANYTRFGIVGYGGRQDCRNISMSWGSLHYGTTAGNYPTVAVTMAGNNYQYMYGSGSNINPAYYKYMVSTGGTLQHYDGATVENSAINGIMDMRSYGQAGGITKMTIRDSEYNYIIMITNYDCTNLDKDNYEIRNVTTGRTYTTRDIRYYYDIKIGRFYDCKFMDGLRDNGS